MTHDVQPLSAVREDDGSEGGSSSHGMPLRTQYAGNSSSRLDPVTPVTPPPAADAYMLTEFFDQVVGIKVGLFSGFFTRCPILQGPCQSGDAAAR